MKSILVCSCKVLVWFIKYWNATVSAAYSPPNYPIKRELFVNYFNELGNIFPEGVGFNEKHRTWGLSLLSPGRDRILYQVVNKVTLGY